jgi:hypothetical protein
MAPHLRAGGITDEDYEEFRTQVSNILTQAGAPHSHSKWVTLTKDSTVTHLADAFKVPENAYRTYLTTFTPWGPKESCTCTGPAELAACNCGKFRSTITNKRDLLTQGAHVPDPNLDPGFRSHAPEHRRTHPYTLPFPATPPLPTQTPTEANAPHAHPSEFLYPGSNIAPFARYLGAPIEGGHSTSAVADFLAERRDHATDLHQRLRHLSNRAAYFLLRYIALPRASFLPAVTHPDKLTSYLQAFDEATDTEWLRILHLHPDDPRTPTMIKRRTLPVAMGGAGIPHTADIAPAALLASVKASMPLLAAHHPDLHAHLLTTLSTSDPLGVNGAYHSCKRIHDELADTLNPTGWHPTARCKPPTALPNTARKALLARQNYTTLTLSKNLHALTRATLLPHLRDNPEDYPDAATELVAQSAKLAGAWLNIPPAYAYILTAPPPQPDNYWTAGFRRWAGAPPEADPAAHICSHLTTKNGVPTTVAHPLTHCHAASCNKGGWHTMRHDSLRDIWAGACRESGEIAIVEPHLPTAPARDTKPGETPTAFYTPRADVRATTLGGRQHYYDVVVTHPTPRKGDLWAPLTAALRAHKAKVGHYARHRSRYEANPTPHRPWPLTNPVMPLAFETHGGAHADVHAAIRKMASAYESLHPPGHNPAAKAGFSARTWHALSTAIHLGVGAQIVNLATATPTPAYHRRTLLQSSPHLTLPAQQLASSGSVAKGPVADERRRSPTPAPIPDPHTHPPRRPKSPSHTAHPQAAPQTTATSQPTAYCIPCSMPIVPARYI